MESNYAEFITYYKNLPKLSGTCRIYERNDGFSLYGDDASLVNLEILKATRLKVLQSGDEKLNYVNVSKANLIQCLKHLLFVRQYKIEILRNAGTIKAPQWSVTCKASPGNFTALEDLIFEGSDAYVQQSRGLLAIKLMCQGPDMVLGIAHCDVVLREIQMCEITDTLEFNNLQTLLVQLSPQECLLAEQNASMKLPESSPRYALEKILKMHQMAISECKLGYFSTADVVQDLNRLLNFEEGQDFRNSMKDEWDMKLALSSVAATIKHLELLSDDHNFNQFTLSIFKSELYAKVDTQSVRGLGLYPENAKDYSEKDYLLGHLNSCFTSSGERLLMQWIKQPLLDLRKLEERLDILEIFVSDISLQTETSKHISKFPDIETLTRKMQRRNATLQDLYKVFMMLSQLPELHHTLSKYSGSHEDILKGIFIDELKEKIEDLENFRVMIHSTLDFEAIKNKEFVVKPEYDEHLLSVREQMTELKDSMNSDLNVVKRDLDIPTVKLECSGNIGYAFRVTRKEEKNLRNKKGYVVIDTKASGVRFQSSSLKQFNEQYLILVKKYEDIQKVIVGKMIEVAVTYIQPLKSLGHTIAWLDVSLSFARVCLGAAKPYIRPQLKEKGKCCIILKQARHPFLESKVENFIPNDVELTKEKHMFYFVTGPNMGGKSTYIRSVALNVLLAQIGCFVPCDKAVISLTDAFLTRIGSCDKPSLGVSTFMYEMLEAKNIMKFATPSSLIIIDEMGRGTSTYDGFGLSWAISKHIAENLKTPCLFATHFHELTDLSKTISSVGNLHVEALSSDGEIIFLYRVKPGVCDESFGIHVSKLAEFPDTVIKKAEEKLKDLNQSISFDEILNTFSYVTGGEIFTQAFQKIPLSESLEENFKEKLCTISNAQYSVQKNDENAPSAINTSVTSNVASSDFDQNAKLEEHVQQLEHLDKIVQKLEKEMRQRGGVLDRNCSFVM